MDKRLEVLNEQIKRLQKENLELKAENKALMFELDILWDTAEELANWEDQDDM